MPTPETFAPLKAYYKSLLPDMTDDSWMVCESVLTVRRLKKGDMLVKEGDLCKYVSFVNHGLLRMYYLVDGKEKVMGFFNEHTYVSDYKSFLTKKPADSYIVVMEDTELVETSYEGLQMIYRQVPEANLLGRLVAERLFIEMCERNSTDVSTSIEERYQQVIDTQPWLLQRVPQYMIASMLGITPEALSRIKGRSGKRKVLANV